ncbi:class I SAM-dependent methyltransferase [Salinisphaera sp. SPP-AMP-43]|uniref:class I SAM-dependent methyltransferase n=1 Tax=Salinisphaera sp. SPP-AMP-43 TaxID=3121288 RepID=UPI003C6DFB55
MNGDTRQVVWHIDPATPQAESDAKRAQALAIPVASSLPEVGFFITRDAQSLVIHHAQASAGDTGIRCVLADPAELDKRRAGGRQSPMARAFGLHRHPPMRVLDTTAGLGRDAATLATLGCTVMPVERQPALYALLADASERIEADDAAPPEWWPNWVLPVHAEAGQWLTTRTDAGDFDAIYIDPMFASPRRKSQPQKALAWLAEIAGTDEDAGALLAVARQHALRRVVVKQHARAEPLAPPDLTMSGRAIRFDIYLTGR